MKSLPTYLPPDGRPEALPSSPSETDGAERFGTPPTPPLRAKDAMLGLDSESCIERNRCKFFNSAYKLPRQALRVPGVNRPFDQPKTLSHVPPFYYAAPSVGYCYLPNFHATPRSTQHDVINIEEGVVAQRFFGGVV